MTKDEALKMAGYDLDGVIADVEKFDGFDDVCLKTIKRVRSIIAKALEQPAIEPVADDELHLAKHAKEYHRLTLNQFKLMCNEADKRYEGQFANSVDKHLAVESFYEGFKVGCTHPHQWQGLTDDEMKEIIMRVTDINIIDITPSEFAISRAIEQALKEKNT